MHASSKHARRAAAQDLARLTGLNALNISFNPMPKFPPVIGRLAALLELNLDYTGTHCTALHAMLHILAILAVTSTAAGSSARMCDP
jgi:hypothetical protein